MALNSKQKLFVKEYLVDGNATRAYRTIKPTCTDKTARTEGSKLLTNPDIAEAIQKGFAARMADAERRAAAVDITKDRWVQELAKVAFANIDDFITIEPKPTFNGRSGKRYEVLTAVPKATASRPRELGAAIKRIIETKNGIGIELHSKQAALDTLGAHFGWVKHDLGVAQAPNVQVILTLPANGREAKKDEQE